MQDGDNCTLTWWVNATGDTYSVYEFYATSESINYSANISSSNSPIINITIVKEITWNFTLQREDDPPVDGDVYIDVNDTVTANINLTTPASANMYIYRDGILKMSTDAGQSITYQDDYTEDKYYNLTAVFPAQDGYPLTTITRWVIVGPDVTNPTTTLVSPENNSWFNIQDINFTFTANDNYLENLNCSL